jgi:predicted DNA-binding transcriptional regulator AlpA
MFNPDEPLLNDKEVAKTLALSPSWVRKQRLLRKRKLPHTLTVDPVMIGRSPRYRQEDMKKWADGLKQDDPPD